MHIIKFIKKRVIAFIVCLLIVTGLLWNIWYSINSKAEENNENMTDIIYEDASCKEVIEQNIQINEKELPAIGEKVYSYSENGIYYNLIVTVNGYNQNSQIIDKDGNTRTDINFINNKSIMEIKKYEKLVLIRIIVIYIM